VRGSVRWSSKSLMEVAWAVARVGFQLDRGRRCQRRREVEAPEGWPRTASRARVSRHPIGSAGRPSAVTPWGAAPGGSTDDGTACCGCSRVVGVQGFPVSLPCIWAGRGRPRPTPNHRVDLPESSREDRPYAQVVARREREEGGSPSLGGRKLSGTERTSASPRCRAAVRCCWAESASAIEARGNTPAVRVGAN
jgi:hypothetical protein